MKSVTFFCVFFLFTLSLPHLSQAKGDEIRLTYYTGKDYISQKMNKVFYDKDAMESLKFTVKILCIDMQSEDIDTIPIMLGILEKIEHIEIEWKTEKTSIYGLQMFPKLNRLSLTSSKLNFMQSDTVWLKQIKILDVVKGSELGGLCSFLWLSGLEQLYVESAKVSCSPPKDINSLTKLSVFRCGPHCSLVKDLRNIDLEILTNIREIIIESNDCETIGIPMNISLSKSLETMRINHPNLTSKEKKILSRFGKNEEY